MQSINHQVSSAISFDAAKHYIEQLDLNYIIEAMCATNYPRHAGHYQMRHSVLYYTKTFCYYKKNTCLNHWCLHVKSMNFGITIFYIRKII